MVVFGVWPEAHAILIKGFWHSHVGLLAPEDKMIKEHHNIFSYMSHTHLGVTLKNGIIIEMGMGSTYIIFPGFSSFQVKSHCI